MIATPMPIAQPAVRTVACSAAMSAVRDVSSPAISPRRVRFDPGDLTAQGRFDPGDLAAQGRLELPEVGLRGEMLVRFFKSGDAFVD